MVPISNYSSQHPNTSQYLTLSHHGIHFLIHIFVGILGLFCFGYFFGSITTYEILLFLLVSFLPMIDEMIFSVLHYVDNIYARSSLNYYLAGDITQYVLTLHKYRQEFSERVIHNIFTYLGLWVVWCAAYIYVYAPVYYFLSAIITHLCLDLVNDEYEYQTHLHWWWPIKMLTQH